VRGATATRAGGIDPAGRILRGRAS